MDHVNARNSYKNISMAHPSYSIAVFHDQEYKRKWCRCRNTAKYLRKAWKYKRCLFSKIEPIKVASVTVSGSYEQMTNVNEAAAKWIETEGYELAGPMFNIYHVSPTMESDPNKWVTEVCYPVKWW